MRLLGRATLGSPFGSTETVGSIETTHGYDELGRLISSSSPSATTGYTWDARGHLTRIAAGETTATYAYGVEGMRQSKSVETSVGVVTTKSVWDGQRLVAEEYSDDSRADFLYGPEGLPLELVYTADGGSKTIYAYQLDAGGSVIGLTTASGTEVASFAYDPWGAPIAASVDASHPAAARNPLRYPGYYFDAESGLYYLPARYYDPKTARFLSSDPAPPAAGAPASLNRYAYCEGDPVNAADPTGEAPDYDGNGKIDSWDSQAHAASLTTNKKMKAYFGSRAMASWYGYQWRQAIQRKQMLRAARALERALLALTAARAAIGADLRGWPVPTKPDKIDMALSYAGLGLDVLNIVGYGALGLATLLRSPTAAKAAGQLMLSAGKAETVVNGFALGYVVGGVGANTKSFGDLVIETVKFGYSMEPGSSTTSFGIDAILSTEYESLEWYH